MKNVRIFLEKLGTGTIFVLICFMGMILGFLVQNGIPLFPFTADPDIQKTLVIFSVFFLFSIAGLVLLIRREEGRLGYIISVFAVVWIVANLLIALFPVYWLIIHR